MMNDFIFKIRKIVYTIGIPPVLYLTLNRTIRNEIRELILKLVCIDIARLSHQTQAEVRHISGMERNESNNA